MSEVSVRDAVEADVTAITRIYGDAVLTTTATWDLEPPTPQERQAWFAARRASGEAVVVAELDGEVVGYGAYGPFRDKCGYARTKEHSLYVDASTRGRGVGRLILQGLVDRARQAGVHTLVGALTAGNEASLRLHEAFGFREVGRLPQTGAKFDGWLELVLVQLLLDDAPSP